MRRFIRHPSDIPIHYTVVENGTRNTNALKNISQGGLCFLSPVHIEPGCVIRVNIASGQPPFEVTGTVVWCSRTNHHYDMGVKFDDASVEFAVRMVEQVCHIEQYREYVLKSEGRRMSGEEAAAEWIAKFAENFPR
jgi:hypothetical protein